MDTKIAATGEAIGSTLAKYRSEFMMLLAVCIMIGGYVFSAFMYKDICVFIQAQTEAQVETAKTLAEMNNLRAVFVASFTTGFVPCRFSLGNCSDRYFFILYVIAIS